MKTRREKNKCVAWAKNGRKNSQGKNPRCGFLFVVVVVVVVVVVCAGDVALLRLVRRRL